MTQSGGIKRVSAVFDRRPASDLQARDEGSVGWSGYGMGVFSHRPGTRNSVEDRVLAIGNRVTDLLRRARAEHRPPGDVTDEVARGLIGCGARRAIDAVTRAFA
jgi:hypothetical protein